MKSKLLQKTLGAVGLLCLVALLIGTKAVAASGGDTLLPNVKKQDDIAKLVPSSIRDKGKITFVMTTSSPPAHYTEGGEVKGLDKDLAVSIARVFGLKPIIKAIPLDGLIPGIQAHRYDVAITQFRATPARGKVLDFIDYAQAGPGFATLAGNPENLELNNLCGVTIGVQKGSSQAIKLVPELNDKCKKAGNDPIDVKAFSSQTETLLALRSKRVEGVLLDSPVLSYAAGKSDKIEMLGKLKSNTVAIGVLKNSGLATPLQSALKYLKKTGKYNKIFEKWNLKGSEISRFKINHVISK
jgi:polar amino acid transport system substrate-binding protein